MVFEWCLFSIFGLLIAHRSFQLLEQRFFSSQNSRNSNLALIITMFFVLFMALSCRKTPRFVLFFDFFVLLIPLFYIFIEKISLQRQVVSQIVSVLDILILKMSAGESFRESFRVCIEGKSHQMEKILKDFYVSLSFDREFHDPRLKKSQLKVFWELKRIETERYQQIEQLKALRNKLKAEASIRQKSRAALMQAKLQSYVMVFLYFIIFFFMWNQFNWQKISTALSISFPFFLIGYVWVLNLGRRMPWKL